MTRVSISLALLAALAAGPALAGGSGWLTDYKKALTKAEKSGRPILVEFSTSDAGETCRKLDKEVFFQAKFKSWAKKSVVLLHADFPAKKYQNKKLKKQNAELKRRFKIEAFPTVLVLSPEGKEIGRTGYLEGGVEKWLEKVKPLVDAGAGSGEWIEDWEKAKKLAKTTGRPILADFTGSDWCGWCIKLKKEVFDTPGFKEWSKSKVILLELDYPRKTKQPDDLVAQNKKLQQQFQIRGFPTVLFLDHKGKVLYRSGYKKGGPSAWIADAEKNLGKKLP